MSDNELDDLFKEAAEGFKPPQDASAWKQMATKLDQSTPAPGFWNWKSISAVTVAAVVILTGTWYTIKPNQQTFKNEQYGSNNATTGVVQEQKEQTHKTGEQNIAPTQPLESKAGGVDVVKKKTDNPSRVLQRKVQSNLKSAAILTEITYTPNIIPQDESSPNQELPIENIVSEGSTIEKASARNLASQTQPPAMDSVESLKQVNTDSAVQTQDDEKRPEKKKSSSGFSIKATVSPDFSSVNFFSASKPGINYGFLAGYSFNNRWSVYTGVISSKKLYTSDEVEGSYTSAGHDYPVKELEGDCRILDIPVNVYYSFFPERSFSLSVGLGLSSYIMRKETYVYCVDNYGLDVYYEQRIRGKNNEWFKVLNVSVIAGKKLTNRLSAEFEPFVKAPLAGVGEGKVSLVSMGAFINVKYDLSIRK